MWPRFARAQGTGVQVERWGPAQGLPQNSVNGLAQTPDGYLWVATYGGLVRFNGYTFERASGPAARFARSRIQNVQATPGGHLWVMQEDQGLWFVDGRRAQPLPMPGSGARHYDLGRINVRGRQGALLAGPYVGLLSEGAVRYVRIPAAAQQRAPVEVTWRPDGAVLLSGLGMTRLSPHAPVLAGTAGIGLSTLFTDAEGAVWAGTEFSLVRVGREGQFDDFRKAVTLPRVRVINRDPHGDLYVGTFDGLFRFAGGRITPAAMTRVADGSIKALLVDREGAVWFGTESEGLGRLRPHVAQALPLPVAFAANGITGLHRAADGRAFVSGNCTGVVTRAPGAAEAMQVPGTEGWCSWAMTTTRAGDLWIGTWGHGLLHGTAAGVRLAEGAANLPGSVVLALYEDRTGHLWAAERTRGVFRWTGTAWHLEAPALRDVRFFYEDRAGRLWAGGGEGLYRRDAGRFGRVREVPVTASVRALYEDAQGVYWVGTYGQGLLRVRDGRLAIVNDADGLPDASVSSITEDAAGLLWLSHNQGVTRVSRTALGAYLEGRAAGPALPPLMRTFVEADGMPSTETNGGFQGAALLFADGQLWVPTIRGVAVFRPGEIAQAPSHPLTRLEQVEVDDVRQPLGPGEVRLAPGVRRFTFRAVTLTSAGTEGLRYRVQLGGFDPDWVMLGAAREATYTNLAPGRYRFRVQAHAGDGAWQEAAPFAFRIAPHAWETVPFWLAVVLIVAGGIVGVWRLRTRSLRRRGLRLERDVRTRTTELKTANGRLAAQRDALEAAAAERAALVRTVSHDLKSPLSGIVGLAADLAEDFAPESSERELAECIARSGQHLIDLVRDVLDRAAYEHVRLDVAALVRDVATVHRVHAARKEQTLIAHGDAVAFILGDGLRFRAAVENLVGNAIKFTPFGGRIEVQTRQEAGDVVVIVDDSGPGLGDGLADLFAPFARGAARPTGGETSTGIGLSIVRDVCAAHGGRVEAGRSPLGGARFMLCVPGAPEAFLPEGPPLNRAPGALPAGGYRNDVPATPVDAEVIGHGGGVVAEGGAQAEVARSAAGHEQRHELAVVVRRGRRGVVAVVGGEEQAGAVRKRGQEVREARVEGFEGAGKARPRRCGGRSPGRRRRGWSTRTWACPRPWPRAWRRAFRRRPPRWRPSCGSRRSRRPRTGRRSCRRPPCARRGRAGGPARWARTVRGQSRAAWLRRACRAPRR